MTGNVGARLDPKVEGALRNAACSLVVLVHVNIYTRPDIDDWWQGCELVSPFFSLVVPVFFLLSGFVAIGQSPGTALGAQSVAKLVRRLRRFIAPFLFWNAVGVALDVWRGGDWRVDLPDIVTGNWQLYFVFVLMQFQLVAFVASRRVEARHLDGVLIVATLVSAASYLVSDIALFRGFGGEGFEETWRKCFAPWSVFFALGAWLRWRPGGMTWLQQHKRWFVLGLVAAYAAFIWELRLEVVVTGEHPRLQLLSGGLPFQIVGTIVVLTTARSLAALAWAAPLIRRLARGARYSFPIYLMHCAWLIVLYWLWQSVGFSIVDWWIVPGLWLTTWTLSRVCAELVERARWRWPMAVLYGVRTARRSSVEGLM